MVNNENDFLGIIIDCADENNDYEWSKVISKSGLSDMDCIAFSKSLEDKGYIRTLNSCEVHINPIAYSVYESPKTKRNKTVKKILIECMKYFISYFVGVITGFTIAYLTFKFGFNG